MELSDYRMSYEKDRLDEASAPPNPFQLFESWFTGVLESGTEDPTAVVLATADKEGKPSARMVLLKDLDKRGFIFYSHYQSRKGRELEENPNASLLFFWKELQRQVRVEGRVERLTSEESDRYFLQRPYENRVSAAISPQSRVIPGRPWLEHQVEQCKSTHADGNIPRPAEWGGYLLIPSQFEFWQGRKDRLHDRLLFTLSANAWLLQRLAP
jgi:pyridoxamine 5'-phosphate oxidase